MDLFIFDSSMFFIIDFLSLIFVVLTMVMLAIPTLWKYAEVLSIHVRLWLFYTTSFQKTFNPACSSRITNIKMQQHRPKLLSSTQYCICRRHHWRWDFMHSYLSTSQHSIDVGLFLCFSPSILFLSTSWCQKTHSYSLLLVLFSFYNALVFLRGPLWCHNCSVF